MAPIVKRLKQTGWTFASHTYNHPDLGAVSLAQVQQDTDRWERYVQPLLGRNTRILVYPFGSPVPAGSAKLAALRKAGFRVFCTIGPTASLTLTDGYAVQARVHAPLSYSKTRTACSWPAVARSRSPSSSQSAQARAPVPILMVCCHILVKAPSPSLA